ncbi:MAG: hypothetical protein IKE01_06875 [Clostridia bacterium]|nr:hypothetical protein [Clostridia bacterium]
MKKFTKILLIVVMLSFSCLLFGSLTYADENNTATNTSLVSTQNAATQTQTTGDIMPVVGNAKSSENEFFSAPNIINILLIAVGIVLILLSIAIFTRLKK